MSFLKENKLNVNIPLESKNGKLIEVIDSPFGVLHAIVFNFCEGELIEIDDLTEHQWYLWGAALGDLHHHSKQFTSMYEDNRTRNFATLLKNVEAAIPSKEEAALRELDVIKGWMENLDQTSENYGFIHFDFELDNLIWSGKKVQVIDFEDSIDGWFAADIANALRDLFSVGVNLSHKYFQLFIKGYRTKITITEKELNEIPMFLRFHNLFSYSILLQTLDIGTSANNPEWIKDLNNKLESKRLDCKRSFNK